MSAFAVLETKDGNEVSAGLGCFERSGERSWGPPLSLGCSRNAGMLGVLVPQITPHPTHHDLASLFPRLSPGPMTLCEFYLIETESHFSAQATLELAVLLPQLLEY